MEIPKVASGFITAVVLLVSFFDQTDAGTITFNDPANHGALPNGSIIVVGPGNNNDNPNDSNFQARENRNHTQTFRVQNNITVDKIIIEIEDAIASHRIELKLFRVNNTNAEPLMLGMLLQSATYTFTGGDALTFRPDVESWLNWDLDPNVMLTADNTAGYALQMVDSGATGVGVASDVEWTGSRTNPYAGGRMYRNVNNMLTSNFVNVPLQQNLQGNGDGTLVLVPTMAGGGNGGGAIPEPSTFLLLGFGLAGLLVYRWRCQKRKMGQNRTALI